MDIKIIAVARFRWLQEESGTYTPSTLSGPRTMLTVA